MKLTLLTLLAAATMSLSLSGSEKLNFPFNFDQLASRASDSVDVTLDASLLQLASGLLSADDEDERQVKKLVSKLKGIYVRSFTFDKDGQYSQLDVEALRTQLKTPHWTRIASVKSSKGENSDIFLKKTGDAIEGLVIIDAEPRELTIVHIDGPVNLSELGQLSGHLGIPKIGKPNAKGDKDD